MEHDDYLHLLPEELVGEILQRLPAKCLGRLKIVCKSWWSTINSPCFIARHLLLQNDTNLYDLLVCSTLVVSMGKTIYRLPYDTLTAVEPTTYCPPLGKIGIVSCCNGLILFSDLIRTKWFLWNPTIGQTKLLPSSSSSRPLKRDQIIYYGFGFDTKTMDYKVVLIYPWSFGPMLVEVEMYSLKTNSWTTIATAFTDKVSHWPGWPGFFSNNGMLSWILNHNVDGKARCTILSIDLSSDTIITTLCPSSISGSACNSILVYKESLALVDCRFHTPKRCFDIWVLGEYGVKESWNKLFTINVGPLQGIVRVLGFWKDAGKVFVEKSSPNPLLKELLLLDIATQQTTSLHISKGYKTLFIYRESLVPLESYNN